MKTTLILGAATLALPLIAADPVSEGHDLTPKFKDGQEITISNTIVMGFGLDDASARMGEMEMIPEVPTVDVEVEVLSELSETILATRDGKITKMRRTHTEESFHASGEAGMGGQFQDFDEGDEGPHQGRTFELVANEEGGWDVKDVTEEELDPIEDSLLALQNEKTHFEQLLPKRAVEVGASWEVGDDIFEDMTKAMTAASAEDPDMAPLMGIMETLQDSIEFEAKGKLVSVDGDIAKIEWTMTAELVIDDLFAMIREVMDPDMMGELPESAEGSLELSMEMKGTGTFDLSISQLTSVEMEGEFAVSGEFAMSEQGMEIEANADASGTIEMTTTITVE